MANRYWNPTGAGNWSSTSSWAATDGGTTGSSVPSASDDVFFTATNTNNCTIDTAATALSITSTGYTGSFITDENKTRTLTLSGNWTTTGTLTLGGNSSINRLFIRSGTKGTARTISAGTTALTNIDLQDITGAGAGSWDLSAITGGSGDCGGNSNITFTTGTTTNWQSGTTWSTATWSVRVPLPQDTATFTTAGTETITQDMPRIGSVDFTGSNNKTWTTSTACSFYGNIDLTNLATLTASTQQYTYEGRGTSYMKCAGKIWNKTINVNAPGGTLKFSDNFSGDSVNSQLSGTLGTITAIDGSNNANVSAGAFSFASSFTEVIMGSGTWENLGNSNSTFTPTTLTPGTSTIKLSGTFTANRIFTGGGKTFNNIWIAYSGAYSVTIAGSNTFNDFKIDAGRSVNFTNSTTQTFTTFTATGTAGNLITLRNTSSTTKATLAKAGGGTILCDYMDVNYITGSPADTWYMGTHSTDGGSNTNVYFTGLPTSIKSIFGLAKASVKSVNGLAIASVKSFNGLT